jgi:hypothetical protein
MICFGNGGVVAFFHKIRLPRFTPLPLFYLIQLAETKVMKDSLKPKIGQQILREAIPV